MTTPRRPAVGGLSWHLPAEPLLDRVSTLVVVATALILGAWALQWGHALGVWAHGPSQLRQWLPAGLPAVEAALAIEVFFWLFISLVGLMLIGLRHALHRWALCRAWAVHHDGLIWTWWALDNAHIPGPARQGRIRARLDIGPWLLLQASGPAPFRRSDWMLVRSDRMGPQGAQGVQLRTALNWA